MDIWGGIDGELAGTHPEMRWLLGPCWPPSTPSETQHFTLPHWHSGRLLLDSHLSPQSLFLGHSIVKHSPACQMEQIIFSTPFPHFFGHTSTTAFITEWNSFPLCICLFCQNIQPVLSSYLLPLLSKLNARHTVGLAMFKRGILLFHFMNK